MQKPLPNVAYIDAANLELKFQELKLGFNHRAFYQILRRKYQVGRACWFTGYLQERKDFYSYLQNSGYSLCFRDAWRGPRGKVKSNCDIDLAIQAVSDVYESSFDKAILVSSDGDFASLIKFLVQKEHFGILMSPAPYEECARSLKDLKVPTIYLPDLLGSPPA